MSVKTTFKVLIVKLMRIFLIKNIAVRELSALGLVNLRKYKT